MRGQYNDTCICDRSLHRSVIVVIHLSAPSPPPLSFPFITEVDQLCRSDALVQHFFSPLRQLRHHQPRQQAAQRRMKVGRQQREERILRVGAVVEEKMKERRKGREELRRRNKERDRRGGDGGEEREGKRMNNILSVTVRAKEVDDIDISTFYQSSSPSLVSTSASLCFSLSFLPYLIRLFVRNAQLCCNSFSFPRIYAFESTSKCVAQYCADRFRLRCREQI